MLVCRQGLKDNDVTLYDYGSYQVIENGKVRYFYSGEIILKVSDISSNVLDKLIYAINKGIRYFFFEGYLLQYIPSFGYGNYFVFKTEIKDEELNNKSLQLLEGVRASLNFHEFVSNSQPLGSTKVTSVTPPPPLR